MKSATTIAVHAFAAAAIAQDLPNCASDCIQPDNIPGCSGGLSNLTCICNNQPYISSLEGCVVQQCNPAAVGQAIAYANKLCNPLGVTITSPAVQPSGTPAWLTATAETGPASITSDPSAPSKGSESASACTAKSSSKHTDTNTTMATTTVNTTTIAPAPTSTGGAGEFIVADSAALAGLVIAAAFLV